MTDGGRFGGYGMYVLKEKPSFVWNLLDLKRVKLASDTPLTPGKHTLVFDFKYDGLGFATLAFNNMSGIGRSGTGRFIVDDKVVATQVLDHTIPLTLPWDETFDIGSDTGTPVDDQDYQVPFPFRGTIDKLTIVVDAPKLTSDDVQKLEAAYRAAQDANSRSEVPNWNAGFDPKRPLFSGDRVLALSRVEGTIMRDLEGCSLCGFAECSLSSPA